MVSIAMPPDDDDALEDCAELGGGLAVVVACAAVLVLVCSVDLVSLLAKLVELVAGLAALVVVCLLLGHSAATPNPFWNTPIMLVSPTSTSLHSVFTLTPIRTRPARHWTLHTAAAAKSEAAHPSIEVVYTARHADGRLSMRGVNEDREMSVAAVSRASRREARSRCMVVRLLRQWVVRALALVVE